MSAEIVLEKIEALPALSNKVQEIIDICDNPNSSLAELCNAIEADPLLTTNILKSANCSHRQLEQPVTDIRKAVTLFGMDSIKGFILSDFITKLEKCDLSPYNLDTGHFMEILRQQHTFTTEWYAEEKKTYSALAMISHLMEVGKIFLSQVIIETSSQKLFAYHIAQTTNLHELLRMEKEIFDITHEEVAAELMRKWGFDNNICIPLAHIGTPESAPEEYRKTARILNVVKSVVDAQHFDRRQNLSHAVQLVKRHHLKPETFVKTYKMFIQPKTVTA